MKEDMITGKPGRALFFFAIPMVLGNLFQQMYNMIDSVIVGRFVGENALAAVGASFAIAMLFISVATGGGIGCSVIISQQFGAEKYRAMKTSIYTALLTILGLSIALAVVGLAVNQWILKALDTPTDIFNEASVYLGIYFMGLPFLFMFNVLSAVFNALGRSKIPLGFLIFSSLLNIALDLLFVVNFHMGVAGVAWATLIAQGVSAALSFGLLMFHLRQYASEEKPAIYDTSSLKKMVRVAIPSIIQQSVVSLGMLLVQSVVNQYGTSVMAGYASAQKIDSIAIMPMVAVGNAMSTFAAQNIGARKEERLKAGYRASWMMVIAIGVCIAVLLRFAGEVFLMAFLDVDISAAAIATGVEYLHVVSLFYMLMGMMCSANGLLRGAGDTGIFMFSTFLNLGTRVVSAHVLSALIGVSAVWWSIPLGWLVGLTVSHVRVLTGKWKGRLLA